MNLEFILFYCLTWYHARKKWLLMEMKQECQAKEEAHNQALEERQRAQEAEALAQKLRELGIDP